MNCILIFILLLSSVLALHLSPEQMYSVRGLLLKSRLSLAQKTSVQKLLYKTHEKWAIKKAVEFKQLHRYKCADISTDEVVLCAKMGLFRSSRNYNGSTGFTKYADIYVKSELLRFMSARIATNVLYITSKTDPNKSGPPKYQAMLDRIESHPELASNPADTSRQHKQYMSMCDYMWQHINKQDAFTWRVFCYKYDYDFTQIRSNKQVAELMCCSEETVRKTVKQENEKLRKSLSLRLTENIQTAELK